METGDFIKACYPNSPKPDNLMVLAPQAISGTDACPPDCKNYHGGSEEKINACMQCSRRGLQKITEDVGGVLVYGDSPDEYY